MIFWKTTRFFEGEATPLKSFWMASPLRDVERNMHQHEEMARCEGSAGKMR